MSTSSTGTTTTTSIPDTPPKPAVTDNAIYIECTLSVQPLKKRTTSYLGFSNNAAVLVSDITQAWPLVYQDGQLVVSSFPHDLVGTILNTGSAPLLQSGEANENLITYNSPWTVTPSSVSFGSASACVMPDNSIQMVFSGSAPAGCETVTLSSATVQAGCIPGPSSCTEGSVYDSTSGTGDFTVYCNQGLVDYSPWGAIAASFVGCAELCASNKYCTGFYFDASICSISTANCHMQLSTDSPNDVTLRNPTTAELAVGAILYAGILVPGSKPTTSTTTTSSTSSAKGYAPAATTTTTSASS